MAAPVTHHRLAWDPVAQRGEVIFIVGGGTSPVRVPASGADEFSALALMLKGPGVVWDGRMLWSDSNGPRLLAEQVQPDLELLEFNPTAKKIIDVCEDEWPANKSDCSGFVRDAAGALGVTLEGNANDIVDQINSGAWDQIPDGKAAKDAADKGKLVIAGLRGDAQQQPAKHGHVVVVVSGPLSKEKYPTAYWGTLGGTGERAKTLNWAWRAGDRDRIRYGATSVPSAG